MAPGRSVVAQHWAALLVGVAVAATAAEDREAVANVFRSGEVAGTASNDSRRTEHIEHAIEMLEKNVRALEVRLGRATQAPSPSHNIERRLQELERRMESIEREVKRLDERLRRLEGRRPSGSAGER
ncbi:MAG: hypothetical protein N2652_07675 [Kiritimatiellae bacterium]|nr:hypothetical protein [Kiritimatiellia bacterium]